MQKKVLPLLGRPAVSMRSGVGGATWHLEMEIKMEMKYAGYSIKKLIEETLKEGFKEEPYHPLRASIRHFTKWANGMTHWARTIMISEASALMQICPENESKSAGKVKKEKTKELELGREVKMGVNWYEGVLRYNDGKFDSMLKELGALCKKVNVKRKDIDERWNAVKYKIWERTENKIKGKRFSSKERKDIESEIDNPFYASSDSTIKCKDPVLEKMAKQLHRMRVKFYKKYRDFISSITLDTVSYDEQNFLSSYFVHNIFNIGGFESRKQIDNLLKFIKLYKIVFCQEPEPELQRLGRPRKLDETKWKEAIKYHYDYKFLASEASRMEDEIKRTHNAKFGRELETIDNTHKSKILSRLNEIIREKRIRNILLKGVKEIEEMIISDSESIASEKVSRKYEIGKDYFRLNRDWKQASHHHLFDKYKRATLYKRK